MMPDEFEIRGKLSPEEQQRRQLGARLGEAISDEDLAVSMYGDLVRMLHTAGFHEQAEAVGSIITDEIRHRELLIRIFETVV